MNLSDQYTDYEMQNIDNRRQAEIDAVLASGMDEEKKQAKIQNIKETYAKEERALREKQKIPMIAMAIAKTAEGVTGALGNQPWTPANFALAAMVAAAGAIEVATVRDTLIPEIEKGVKFA